MLYMRGSLNLIFITLLQTTIYLRTARCGRSAAAAAALSTAPFWAAYERDSPSTPNKTPPLAIYVRLVALFCF